MSSPTPPPPSNTDRNLLFAVLALHAELIDNDQFAEACAAWTARRETPLADVLVERGWLTTDDRREIERLLERKLKKHGGDVRASLGAVADAGVRDLLRAVGDEDVRKSLSSLPPAAGYVLVETVDVPPRESASRYSLVRLHAQGGLGRVYIAHDKDLNRDVALKEIKPEQAKHPEAWRRFLKEAQITGQLEHPNIVPVYEVSRRQEDDQPFYTMRLVRGQTLRDGLADYHRRRAAGQADPLELPRLLNAFVSVCQALGFAHSRGVVHRDLKPENVMLGDFGQVIVLDWGLAKMADEADDVFAPHVALTADAQTDKTVPGSYIGSPAYMAPEQAAGRADSVDARTDVYGLGAILFEILTGRPPHQGQAGDEVLKAILEKDTPRARAVLSSVPPALDAVCAKAMAKERKTRYATATALADDVQRFLAGEPVSAWPEPWTAKARRWVGRHRVAVTTTAAVLLVATAGLAVATYLLQAAYQDEHAAKELAGVKEQEAQEQRAAAQRQRDQTAKALFELARVTTDRVSQKDAIAIYRQAGDLFAELARDNPEVDAYQNSLATCLHNQGNLLRRTGNVTEAETLYRKAFAIREQLAQGKPSAAEYQNNLAQSRLAFAAVYQQAGRWQAAETELRLAIELCEPLARTPGADPYYVQGLAGSYHNLAALYQDMGQTQKCETFYRRALELREQLARAHPNVPEYRGDMAGSYNNLAHLYRDAGRTEEAEGAYKKALEIRKELVRDQPALIEAHRHLAAVYGNFATFYSSLGRTDEANDANRRAVDILERLVREHPSVTAYRVELASNHDNWGNLCARTGRQGDALQAFQQAHALREKLVADNPGDPEFREGLAQTLHNRATLYSNTGRREQAAEDFRKCLQIREHLVRENPSSLTYRTHLAKTYANFAAQQSEAGHADQAQKTFQQAIDGFEKLAAENPALPEHRFELARTLNNFGILLDVGPRRQAAEKPFRRMIDLLEKLTQEHPEMADYHDELARGLNNLAGLQLAGGQREVAEATYRRSIAIRERLVREHSAVAEYVIGLGGTYGNLGRLLRERGEPAQAVDWFQRASAQLEPLLARAPTNVKARRFLGNVCIERATALTALGRHAEALKDWDRALDLDTGKKRTELTLERGITLARLGKPQEAVAGAKELEANARLDANSLYNAACLYALAADAARADAKRTDEYAARAVALLAEARAAGFFKTPNALADMKKDPDLNALRSRADYKKLIKELEASK